MEASLDILAENSKEIISIFRKVADDHDSTKQLMAEANLKLDALTRRQSKINKPV